MVVKYKLNMCQGFSDLFDDPRYFIRLPFRIGRKGFCCTIIDWFEIPKLHFCDDALSRSAVAFKFAATVMNLYSYISERNINQKQSKQNPLSGVYSSKCTHCIKVSLKFFCQVSCASWMLFKQLETWSELSIKSVFTLCRTHNGSNTREMWCHCRKSTYAARTREPKNRLPRASLQYNRTVLPDPFTRIGGQQVILYLSL